MNPITIQNNAFKSCFVSVVLSRGSFLESIFEKKKIKWNPRLVSSTAKIVWKYLHFAIFQNKTVHRMIESEWDRINYSDLWYEHYYFINRQTKNKSKMQNIERERAFELKQRLLSGQDCLI